MKKLLLILVAVFLVVAIGIGVFIVTFDADRYRPQVVREFERALSRPVTLEHISLGWRDGIVLRLKGLAVYEGREATGEPMMEVESASALVQLMPLLNKDVQVSSLVLSRPNIHVVRDARGRINLLGLAAVPPADRAGTANPDLDTGAGAGSGVGASGREAEAAEAAGGVDAAVSFNIASLRVEEGTLHWTDAMSTPPAELWLRQLDVTVKNIAPGQPMDLEIRGALAGETPNFSLSGRLMPPDASQEGLFEQVRLTVEHLPLGAVVPPAPAGAPHLRGTLSATVEGGTATLEPAKLIRAVSAGGDLKLDELVLVNLNVLDEVFKQLSMLPGLVERLESRLPPDFQAKLDANDTVLEPVDLSMRYERGAMRFQDLEVRTDTFGLSGTGAVGLNGAVDVQALLRVDPAFSAALIRSVSELQYLTNPTGEMEIPLTIRGRGSSLSVLPDLNYVASKLIVTKAQDLLGTLLERVIEKHAPDETETPAE